MIDLDVSRPQGMSAKTVYLRRQKASKNSVFQSMVERQNTSLNIFLRRSYQSDPSVDSLNKFLAIPEHVFMNLYGQRTTITIACATILQLACAFANAKE